MVMKENDVVCFSLELIRFQRSCCTDLEQTQQRTANEIRQRMFITIQQ